MTLSDELSKLAELRANGTLSEEEFRRAKEHLLGSSDIPGPGMGAGVQPAVPAINSLRRSRTDRWFGGVCGGIGRATGVESWVWRLVFTALFICGGFGLLVYLLLWLFVPSE